MKTIGLILMFVSTFALVIMNSNAIDQLKVADAKIKSLETQLAQPKSQSTKNMVIIEPDLQDKNINAYCYSHSKNSTEFTVCKSGAHLKYVFIKGVK